MCRIFVFPVRLFFGSVSILFIFLVHLLVCFVFWSSIWAMILVVFCLNCFCQACRELVIIDTLTLFALSRRLHSYTRLKMLRVSLFQRWWLWIYRILVACRQLLICRFKVWFLCFTVVSYFVGNGFFGWLCSWGCGGVGGLLWLFWF